MKQLIIWFGVLVGMIFFAAWLQKGGLKLPAATTETATLNTKLMKIGEKTINVEIAATPDEQEKGLSGRDSLGADNGMLFVMKKDSMPTFWMKNMRFNLDIIWINGHEVVDTAENIPAPKEGTLDKDFPRYKSRKPIDYVLEVKEGFIKENGIKIGDKVELPEGVD